MRIAILLTGFYRSFDRVRARYQHLAEYYEADVFVHTWNRDEWAVNKDNYTRDITENDFSEFAKHVNLEEIVLHDLEHYRKNRIAFVENNRENDVLKTDPRAREHGTFWANRLRDQWYLVAKGWESITKRYSNYDLVFRSRLDIELSSIELYNANCLVIPKDIGGWDYSDHMAFGNLKSMEKYCNFYYKMQEVYDKYNVDPTHAVNFPRFYLLHTEPPITFLQDQRIVYDIIK